MFFFSFSLELYTYIYIFVYIAGLGRETIFLLCRGGDIAFPSSSCMQCVYVWDVGLCGPHTSHCFLSWSHVLWTDYKLLNTAYMSLFSVIPYIHLYIQIQDRKHCIAHTTLKECKVVNFKQEAQGPWQSVNITCRYRLQIKITYFSDKCTEWPPNYCHRHKGQKCHVHPPEALIFPQMSHFQLWPKFAKIHQMTPKWPDIFQVKSSYAHTTCTPRSKYSSTLLHHELFSKLRPNVLRKVDQIAPIWPKYPCVYYIHHPRLKFLYVLLSAEPFLSYIKCTEWPQWPWHFYVKLCMFIVHMPLKAQMSSFRVTTQFL